MEKKQYLYLVVSKDKTKFKVGYTINPRTRAGNYRTHSLDVIYIGHIEITDKKYERLCHWELMKNNYQKCIIKGSTEWFNGFLNYQEFYDLVMKVTNKGK